MDSIDLEISNINKRLNKLANGLKYDVQKNKALKRKAGRTLEAKMYLLAPRHPKTVKRKGKTIAPGALKRSIKFLNLRRSDDVFVGPDAKIAPHAHLVEFGFAHWKGGFVGGKYFCKKSYEQTKHLVLAELTKLSAKEFEKWGKTLQVNT